MNNILYTSHSAIPSYPPNIIKYPNFYNCKEYTFILRPGDMLYIPSKWFHWVFSYPDEQQNIAISYAVSELNGNIYNEFYFKKPYIFHLNKEEHPFFNYTFNTFKNMYPTHKINTIISNKNILIPVKKQTVKNKISSHQFTFKEMEQLFHKNTHNIYMGQNNLLHPQKPPECILRGFPNSKLICNQWLALFKTNTEYIDSGLHYDLTHGILVQIKGTKLVRLFHPQHYNNLYIQPMYAI
jgi:hypothetical protein